jgi:hypothetical protein
MFARFRLVLVPSVLWSEKLPISEEKNNRAIEFVVFCCLTTVQREYIFESLVWMKAI